MIDLKTYYLLITVGVTQIHWQKIIMDACA